MRVQEDRAAVDTLLKVAGSCLERAADTGARLGADVLRVVTGSDDMGHFLQVVPSWRKGQGLERMPDTVASAIAGPTAAMLFDSLLKDDNPAQWLRKPLLLISTLASPRIGVCPEGDSDLFKLDPSKAEFAYAQRAMLLFMTVNEALVRAVAGGIYHQLAEQQLPTATVDPAFVRDNLGDMRPLLPLLSDKAVFSDIAGCERVLAVARDAGKANAQALGRKFLGRKGAHLHA